MMGSKKGSMISGIIALTIGLIVMANVFMSQVHNTNVTGWSTGETGLWNVLGLVGVAGVVYGTAAVFGIA